jgi:DNA-binding transcriptional MerR regulator
VTKPRRPRTAAAAAELTIDELARRAGTTVRNVRAYQDRGLLPPPRRRGRVGVYSDAHLARLRLIGALLDRGYSLGNIDEMLAAWESGRELSDVLGLEAAVARPFSTEAPGQVSAAELASWFGADPQALTVALQLGILEHEEDGAGARFRVPSPRTLRAGRELVTAGVPMVEVLAHLAALRKDVERIAQRLIGLVADHVFGDVRDRLPPPAEARRLADITRRLRPLAEMVVDAELARALERSARATLGERLDPLLRSATGATGRGARARGPGQKA